MAVSVSNSTGNIEIKLVAYHDCDDVQLFWCTKVDGILYEAIPDCLGFKIERQRKDKDGNWQNIEVLRNRVGFSSSPPQTKGDETQPCSIWPFQTYEWTDHGANSGQTVRYRVSAMKLKAGTLAGEVEMDPIADSGWSGEISVGAYCGKDISAFFNRGDVMSQFVARIARTNQWSAKDIKEHVKELEEPLRRFLSGDLRVAMLQLLDEAIADMGLSFYAALYELSDDELIKQLQLLRGRAHVVLANGSDKKGDGNEESRTQLKSVNVDVRDRMLASKGLGHNKFAVLVRDDKPIKAWTGSTNWAPTGLCTQLNNGILIEDEKMASIYFDQWKRLADAGDGFPAALVQSNAHSPTQAGDSLIWFTRVRNPSKKYTDLGSDLQALINVVNGARQAILYVMFQPGPEPLDSILKRSGDIYVRGVVNQVSKSTREQFSLTGDTGTSNYNTALVQPEGIVKDFSAWVKEVTRAQFLAPSGIGHAITHAKMIVIDPFSDNCKVVTGSHNFSKSASENNDENFVVIQGNKALAEAYAVACISTYSHYRWRAYVKDRVDAGQKVWDHLSDNPAWQSGYLTAAKKKHIAVWCNWQ
ncbi:MAG: phospholipase D-like domain-containing protein [Dehalococcoidia bacterium]